MLRGAEGEHGQGRWLHGAIRRPPLSQRQSSARHGGQGCTSSDEKRWAEPRWFLNRC